MTLLVDEHPNQVAQQLTGRSYISWSALSTYASCPLKYAFKYVEGLPETIVSSSFVFGGAVHSAIEHHFNALMTGEAMPDLDMLLAVFWEAWSARTQEMEVSFSKGEDVNAIGQLADRVLMAFLSSELAEPAGRILGIEEQLTGELVPGVPDLLARIDLLVESDDQLIVTDFKTARSRWSSSQALSQADQVVLYAELARQLVPGKQLVTRFAVLTKAKQPTAEFFPVSVDGQQVDRTKTVIEKIWRAIEQQNFFPAPSSISCGSCPYREPCRAWHG